MVLALRWLALAAATRAVATRGGNAGQPVPAGANRCICSGAVGADDARGRADYGTRCARWDAPAWRS